MNSGTLYWKKINLTYYDVEPKVFRLWEPALQRQNTEISKQIFPGKVYRGLSPNSTLMGLWAIYIFPQSVSLFCWRKYVDRSWDYIIRSQTHECGNFGWGRAIPRKGIHKGDFRCSVVASELTHTLNSLPHLRCLPYLAYRHTTSHMILQVCVVTHPPG